MIFTKEHHLGEFLEEIFIFVPSTTYLGIMIAYILLLAGGSGRYKARTNGSVGWVEHCSGPPE